MKLNAKEQPRLAGKVRAVLLNSKVVPMCHAADEEEGWVMSYIPDLPDIKLESGEVIEQQDHSHMILIRRTGEVKIIFHDEDPSLGD